MLFTVVTWFDDDDDVCHCNMAWFLALDQFACRGRRVVLRGILFIYPYAIIFKPVVEGG